MASIEVEFNLGDKVRVVDLGVKGVVKGICVSTRGIEYVVRYLSSGEYVETMFFAEELVVGDVEPKVGF